MKSFFSAMEKSSLFLKGAKDDVLNDKKMMGLIRMRSIAKEGVVILLKDALKRKQELDNSIEELNLKKQRKERYLRDLQREQMISQQKHWITGGLFFILICLLALQQCMKNH